MTQAETSVVPVDNGEQVVVTGNQGGNLKLVFHITVMWESKIGNISLINTLRTKRMPHYISMKLRYETRLMKYNAIHEILIYTSRDVENLEH